MLRPNRIVVGVKSEWANSMLYSAHKGVFDLAATEDREVPLVVTDFATAELVKVAANAFLATKISFINAMAEVCEAAGGDVTQLARAIGYDPRIGNRFLQAGVGFGGGCLPKDIRAFQARAQELGAGEALRFLHEVDLINLRRRNRVLQLAAELLDRRYGPAGPDLSGTRIAVLGATFKPNSDDVRDAPSLAVAAQLAKAGADVRVYDPQGMENARRAQPDLTYAPDMIEAVRDADLVCVLTEWSDFRNADPEALARARRRPPGRRRAQLPGLDALGPGRLGVPGHGPPLTPTTGRSSGPITQRCVIGPFLCAGPAGEDGSPARIGHAASVDVHSAGRPREGVRTGWRAISAPPAGGPSSPHRPARTAGPSSPSGPRT